MGSKLDRIKYLNLTLFTPYISSFLGSICDMIYDIYLPFIRDEVYFWMPFFCLLSTFLVGRPYFITLLALYLELYLYISHLFFVRH
jgi:hypothetical protein